MPMPIPPALPAAALRAGPRPARPLRRIILHCSATRTGWMARAGLSAQLREIDRWHRARGWSGIGYHLLVGRDGRVAEGRPLARAGAHTRGENADSIGVCLIGGHGAAADDGFAEHFTPAQDCALRALVAELRARFGPLALHGHNEFAPKGCPGFRVAPWWAQSPASKEKADA